VLPNLIIQRVALSVEQQATLHLWRPCISFGNSPSRALQGQTTNPRNASSQQRDERGQSGCGMDVWKHHQVFQFCRL
jgi:hypothetical protein